MVLEDLRTLGLRDPGYRQAQTVDPRRSRCDAPHRRRDVFLRYRALSAQSGLSGEDRAAGSGTGRAFHAAALGNAFRGDPLPGAYGPVWSWPPAPSPISMFNSLLNPCSNSPAGCRTRPCASISASPPGPFPSSERFTCWPSPGSAARFSYAMPDSGASAGSGLAILLFTGALLFWSQPLRLYYSQFFRAENAPAGLDRHQRPASGAIRPPGDGPLAGALGRRDPRVARDCIQVAPCDTISP